MNYLALCQRVREETGVSGTGPASVTNQTGILAKIISWTRQACTDIERLHQQHWNFLWARSTSTLVAGRATCLPGDLGMLDFNHLKSLRIEGRSIYVTPWDEWEEEVENLAYYEAGATGTPKYLTVDPSNNVHLYPAPDKANTATATYYKAPTILSAGTDTPKLPVAYHEAIVWKACMYFAAHEEDAYLYQTAQIKYGEILNEAEANLLPRVTIRGWE